MPATLDEFKDYMAAARSSGTAVAYHKSALRFVRFLRLRGLTIQGMPRSSMQDFVTFLSSEGIRPRSIKLYVAGTRKFLAWLEDRGVQAASLASPDVPRPESGRPGIIDTEMLTTWLSAVASRPEPFRTILALLPFVGLRAEEVCRMRTDNILKTMHGPTLSFHGKGRKVRRVPLSQEAARVLWDYASRFDRAGSRWLFPSADPERHVRPGDLRRQVQLARAEAGLPWVTAHKLRHVFATLMARNGVGIEVIKELLGHSSIQTTAIYVHPDDEGIAQAVENVR